MKFQVEVTVPEGLVVGDKFMVEVETPVTEKKRGQLAGLTLAEMTDEQLKVELINSGSVLYKATQRGAAATTIEANQIRNDAAKAEKLRRHPVVETAVVATEEIVEGESVEVVENDNTEIVECDVNDGTPAEF